MDDRFRSPVLRARLPDSRCAALAVLIALCPAAGAADGTTAEIARSGLGSANFDGLFANFTMPAINNVGTVTFNARLTGTTDGNTSDSGVYRYYGAGRSTVSPVISSGVQEVLRENQSISLSSGNLVAGDLYLTATRLENTPIGGVVPVAGQFSALALELPVRAGLSDGDTAILVESSFGEFTRVAAEGETVPSGNGTFGDLTGFNLFGIGGNREVGFFAAMNDTEQGADDNTGLFRYGPGGGVVELVREGGSAGGATLSGTFTPRMNGFGAVAFLAGLDSGDPQSDGALATIVPHGTAASLRVVEGEALADGDGAFDRFGELRINNDGAIAFGALLRDTDGINGNSSADDSGIFVHDALGTRTLVREGDATPTGDARFGRFEDAFSGDIPRFAFNDLGEVAFEIALSDTSSDRNTGIYRASDDEILEIAREGDMLAGGTFAGFDGPALNNTGIVVFLAELVVGMEVGGEGTFPILETTLVMSDGVDYAIVAREGEDLPGGTLLDIRFNNEWRGAANGLSDAGIVAYEAIYADGTRAINTWRPSLTWRQAADVESGSWDEPGNWFMGLPPSAAHDVNLDPDTHLTVQGPGADTSVRSLTLGQGAGTARLELGEGILEALDGTHIGANGILAGGGTLAGAVVNQGHVEVAAGTLLTLAGDFVNDNLVVLGDGATIAFGGRYSGTGGIAGNGTSSFGGGLAPGASPGLLSIAGDAVLEAGNVLEIEIAGLTRGDTYDAIDVGGTLNLGGTLEILVLEGYQLGPGQYYLLLQAAVLEGDFDEVLLPNITGLTLALVRDGSTLGLRVQAVPLPPAALLLALPLMVLRRRR